MKTVAIDELLAWAFCQELCKVGADNGGQIGFGGSSAWGMVTKFAELGTLVDRTPNAHGVIPGFFEEGEPDPDALAVSQAVSALEHVYFDIATGWNPFPEFEDPYGLIAAEVERVVCEVKLNRERLGSSHICGLVVRAAILKRGPDWRCAQPKFIPMMLNGKPRWFVGREVKDSLGRSYVHEVNGYDAKKCRPLPGAYRKFELADPIYADIYSRLDWQLWQDALQILSDHLHERLVGHRIKVFVPDRQPWARIKTYMATA